ncbi:hypothetical protein [Streptomyces sp. TRM49041]|uniref:hypothetical protein n=1 Tax=Streptomyces sp. TRM49041 TaxID=2603216 RepID=UPI0011EE0CB8|nr:hypothetical protein [Streptomyces sp. TRM49041]
MNTATRYDRHMYALMNRRDTAPFYATAARRRALVGVHVVLTASTVASWLGVVVGGAFWAIFAMLGLLLPWMIANGGINAATRGLLELRGRMLDERQLAERDRVRALAHRITTWLLGLGTAAFGAVLWATDIQLGGHLVFTVLVTALVVHWLMPLWVSGLRVQDDIQGGVEDTVDVM